MSENDLVTLSLGLHVVGESVVAGEIIFFRLICLFSAKMEFHVNKNKKSMQKLFEVGFDLYSDEPDFVLEYIQFLAQRNDFLSSAISNFFVGMYVNLSI